MLNSILRFLFPQVRADYMDKLRLQELNLSLQSHIEELEEKADEHIDTIINLKEQIHELEQKVEKLTVAAATPNPTPSPNPNPDSTRTLSRAVVTAYEAERQAAIDQVLAQIPNVMQTVIEQMRQEQQKAYSTAKE